MKRFDGPAVLLAVSALLLWTGLTDAILRYLRPSMKPWLVLAGVVIGVIGAVALLLERREWVAAGDSRSQAGDSDHDHSGDQPGDKSGDQPGDQFDGETRGQAPEQNHDRPTGPTPGHSHHPHDEDGHRHAIGQPHEDAAGHRDGRRGSRVGWLLLMPVAVAVLVDPGALGAYAVSRQGSLRLVTARDFDLQEHIRAHSFAGQAPELRVSQFVAAARNPNEQDLLASTEVRITGFVVNEDGPPNSFLLARMQIGCCAGDAVAAIVDVRDYAGEPMADETWVEVVGEFDMTSTNSQSEEAGWFVAPILRLASIRLVDQPREPYEYP